MLYVQGNLQEIIFPDMGFLKEYSLNQNFKFSCFKAIQIMKSFWSLPTPFEEIKRYSEKILTFS